MSNEIKEQEGQSSLLKLSVSKSNTFLQCKAKYKFSYILKLPKKEYNYHLFGRFVHRVLELFHLAYINKSHEPFEYEMEVAFNEAVKEVKSKLTLEQKQEGFKICAQYLEKIRKQKEEIDRIISVEKTFNLKINDGLTLTGMIDRVQKDADGVYHIIDYKTSKSAYYLKDDLLQLLTYAYVIYKEYPEIQKVRVSYIMLRLGCEYITKEFNLKEIMSIKDTYEKYATQIHNETEFTPKPQKLCSYCDFLDVCDRGKEFVKTLYKTGETKYQK